MRIFLVGATILASLAPFLNGRVGASPLPYQDGSRTEISPGKVGPVSTLRSSTHDSTALTYLEKRSFTASRGLQQLVRRRRPRNPVEILTGREARHQRERIYHESEMDCHQSAELEAEAQRDTIKAAKHARKSDYHYYKAKSHKAQRDINRLHLNSLSNPQNIPQNASRVQELADKVANSERQAAGYAPRPGEEDLECEA